MAELLHAHPELDQLRDFSLGRLDDEADSALIEAHLETCDVCRQQLETVSGDTLDRLVRTADTAIGDSHPPALPPVSPPAALLDHPRYEIGELLGSGGMGTVYKARHKLMDRDVALKVIHPRLVDSPATVERFRREVRAAARLTHPNIVAAYDAEQAGDVHFLAMEYVPGRSLAQVVAERGPLPVAEACEYARQAALALQHAHEQGMVHRDIKPANLMVAESRDPRVESRPPAVERAPQTVVSSQRSLSGPQPSTLNAQPTLKILDFGLARLVSELPLGGSLTQDGSVMGTPDYMAPEQADDAHLADIRADIYSLGCTLYHLLTGRPPFATGAVMQKLLAHQNKLPRPVGELRDDVPLELARIVERMLAKNPADRYQAPGEVAQALAAFLDTQALAGRGVAEAESAKPQSGLPELTAAGVSDDPISATVTTGAADESPLPKPGRNRVRVSRRWLVAFGLLIVLGGGLLAQQIIIRIYNKDGQEVGQASVPADGSFKAELAAERRADVAKRAPTPEPRDIAIEPAPLPEIKGGEPLSPSALVQRPAKIPGVRSWTIETDGHRGQIGAVAYSPDGSLLATAGEDSNVRIWDAQTAKLIQILVGAVQNSRRQFLYEGIALAWSHDGKKLATTLRGGIATWDVATGRCEAIYGEGGSCRSVGWSKDGNVLIADDAQTQMVYLREAATGKKLSGFEGVAPALSPDGTVLAVVVPGTRMVQFHDLAAGTLAGSIDISAPGRLAWAPDGKSIGLSAGSIFVYEFPSKRLLFEKQSWENHGLTGGWDWTPDSKYIVATTLFGNGYGHVTLIHGRTGQLFGELMTGGTTPGNCVACSSTGDVVFAYANWGTLGRVRLTAAEEFRWLEPLSYGMANPFPFALAWAVDGKTLTAGCYSQLVGDAPQEYRWDVASGKQLSVAAAGATRQFSPDQKRYIDGFAIHDATTGQSIATLDLPDGDGKISYAWSADGMSIAACRTAEEIRVFDASNGDLRTEVSHSEKSGEPAVLAFAPDGKTLACGSWSGSIVLLDVESGRTRGGLEAPCHVTALAWSPDGKRFAVATHVTPQPGGATYDGAVQIWTGDGRNRLFTRQMDFPVHSLSWSPDSKTLATGFHDAVRLWDTAGELRATITGFWGWPHERATLVVMPTGHYCCDDSHEQYIRYVAALDNGTQITLTPAEFATRFGWKNDPEKVGLAAPSTVVVPSKQRPPIEIAADPLPPIQGGEPVSNAALVQRPAMIEGMRSWTIETVKPRGSLLGAAYRPDGKLVAVAGADGTIRLYDAPTGRLVRALIGHAGLVGGGSGHTYSGPVLAWSPDGKLLASVGGTDHTVRLWDADAGLSLRILSIGAPPVAASWSPDGRYLAVGIGSGGPVRRLDIFDSASGERLRGTALPNIPLSVAWAPEDNTVAVGFHQDGGVRLFDATSLNLLHIVDAKGSVSGVAFSPDGSRLFTAGALSCCWHPKSGENLWKLENGAISVACSPDGKSAAFGAYDGTVLLAKAESGEVIHTLQFPHSGGNFRLSGVSWSPDSGIVSAGSAESVAFCSWDIDSGELVKTVEGLPALPPGTINVAWSTDGSAVGLGYRSPPQFWEVATGKPLTTHPGNYAPTYTPYSPDGTKRLIDSGDGRLKIIEVSSGADLHVLDVDGFQHTIIPWSPDGKWIALGVAPSYVYAAEIWDVETGKRMRSIKGLARGMAFSPDSKVLAIGDNIGAIRLWDVQSGESLDTFRGRATDVEDILWSVDGKTLTADAVDGMRDWDVETGRMVRHRSWRLGRPSPDQRFGADLHVNTIRVWDLETGQRRLTIMPLPDDRYIVFSPDGHYRGSRAVERDIVYVVQLDDGRQETLTPAEFATRFGWKNDPEQVGLAAGAPAAASNLDAPTPRAADPDRRAAEWVLSIGGNVQVRVNGEERAVNDASQLPPEKFVLWLVSLIGNPRVNDETLVNLAGCTGLTHVSLDSTPVTDAGLAHLAACENLKHLTLYGTSVTNIGLSNCKDLEVLGLGSTPVTDAGLACFKESRNLTALYLMESTAFSDEGLTNFAECKKLTILSVERCPQVTDAGLAYFKGCKDLTYLSLEGTQVSDAGLAFFAECKALRTLDLTGTRVTEAGMAHFRDCRNLGELFLARVPASDAGLAHFSACTDLTNVELHETAITDAGLAHLRDMPHLSRLSLANTRIGDAGLESLKGLSSLTHLNLGMTQVSDAGLEHLENLIGVTWLNLSGTRVSDAGLQHLKGLTNLTSLGLAGTRLTDESLALLAGMPNVSHLDVGITRISATGIATLRAALPHAVIAWSEPNRLAAEAVLTRGGTVQIRLKGESEDRPIQTAAELPPDDFQVTRVRLVASGNPDQEWHKIVALHDPQFDGLEVIEASGEAEIYNFRVQMLKDHHRLREIVLAGRDVDDSGVAPLKDLPDLRRLILDGCPVTGTAFAPAAVDSAEPDFFNALTELSLARTQINDAGLAHLKGLQKLRRLNLDGCTIRGPGLAHLKDLPELRELRLGCPPFTDLFADRLGELKQLESLSLEGSALTDEGLKALHGLDSLRELDLTGTKVTEAGVAELKAALPSCQVTR